MPGSATAAAERDPRPARSLTPGGTPRRGELTAALGLLGLLAHVLLAQLALLLAIVLDLTSRTARWRPVWLAGPAAAGLIWALAIGPARTLAGFTDGPHQVLSYLAGAAGQPARVLHPGRAFAGVGRWLPRQAPLALIVASAEVAVACWLRARRPGERGLPPPRPGLIVAVRRRLTAAWVGSGGVVTRTGACLGADWRTGRPAEISWRAAEGGVLVTGAGAAGTGVAGTGVAGTGAADVSAVADVFAASFQLVYAAIRRRKPVLVVDLAGLGALPGALATICADSGAPLHVFGPAGQGCYEPLRGGDPVRKAALVMGMVDWGPVADHARRTCGAYLNDLFAVTAAAPGDPRVPVLDDVAALLSPAALRARMRQVPPYHPRRGPLGERVSVSASLLEADPATASFLAGELTGLRSSVLGGWLRAAGPPGAGPAGPGQISLSAVVRERAVAFFPLDQPRHGRPAQMIANLVTLDAAAVFAESRHLGGDGDGLAWFGAADAVAAPALAQLISTGAGAGVATVLSTLSPQAAGQLAALANVLVVCGPGDPGLAEIAPDTTLAAGQFALAVNRPERQVVPLGRLIPGRLTPGRLTPGQLTPGRMP